MARSALFQGLRRRRRVPGALVAYALLLNALIAVVFNVQAIAASLNPLSVAATCDSTGSGPTGDPVRHNRQHQPDCTLCSSACPMGGLMPGLGGTISLATASASSYALDFRAPSKSSVNPPSVYRSDTDAQGPPAIG